MPKRDKSKHWRVLKNLATYWNIRHHWFQLVPISFSLAKFLCKRALCIRALCNQLTWGFYSIRSNVQAGVHTTDGPAVDAANVRIIVVFATWQVRTVACHLFCDLLTLNCHYSSTKNSCPFAIRFCWRLPRCFNYKLLFQDVEISAYPTFSSCLHWRQQWHHTCKYVRLLLPFSWLPDCYVASARASAKCHCHCAWKLMVIRCSHVITITCWWPVSTLSAFTFC